jgi:hypothetical protein
VIAKGATFIDSRPLLLSPDGAYMNVGPDDTGEIRKLRERDGVTFFKQGNNKFGQLILAAIQNTINGVPLDATSPIAAAPTQNDVPTGPVFGQDDANGAAVLLNSGDVVASASPSVPVVKVDANAPAPGTAAEKLFTSGEAVVAPLGRFDDFSYVAPAGN